MPIVEGFWCLAFEELDHWECSTLGGGKSRELDVDDDGMMLSWCDVMDTRAVTTTNFRLGPAVTGIDRDTYFRL